MLRVNIVFVALALALVKGDPIPRVPYGPAKLPYEGDLSPSYPFNPGPGPDPATIKTKISTRTKKTSTPAVPSVSTPLPTTGAASDLSVRAAASTGPIHASGSISGAGTTASLTPGDPACTDNSSYGTSYPTVSHITAPRPSYTSHPSNSTTVYLSTLPTSPDSLSTDPSSRPSSYKPLNHTHGTGYASVSASASASISISPSLGTGKSYPYPNSSITLDPTVSGSAGVTGSFSTSAGTAASLASISGKPYHYPYHTLPIDPTAITGISSGSGLSFIISRFTITSTLPAASGSSGGIDPRSVSANGTYGKPSCGPYPPRSLNLTTLVRSGTETVSVSAAATGTGTALDPSGAGTSSTVPPYPSPMLSRDPSRSASAAGSVKGTAVGSVSVSGSGSGSAAATSRVPGTGTGTGIVVGTGTAVGTGTGTGTETGEAVTLSTVTTIVSNGPKVPIAPLPNKSVAPYIADDEGDEKAKGYLQALLDKSGLGG